MADGAIRLPAAWRCCRAIPATTAWALPRWPRRRVLALAAGSVAGVAGRGCVAASQRRGWPAGRRWRRSRSTAAAGFSRVSASIRNAPAAATRSPAFSPLSTGYRSPLRGPELHLDPLEHARLPLDVDDLLRAGVDHGPLGHGQDFSRPSLRETVAVRRDFVRTLAASGTRVTAELQASRIGIAVLSPFPSPGPLPVERAMLIRTVAYMPGRNSPSGLATSKRTRLVRVAVSSCG